MSDKNAPKGLKANLAGTVAPSAATAHFRRRVGADCRLCRGLHAAGLEHRSHVEKLAAEEKRLSVAEDIEHLRKEEKRFVQRIPGKRDPDEWIEYFLSGIRPLPLKLNSLDAKPPIDVGPYQAIVVNCELEGSFPDMEKLIRWIEYNDRLIRIDLLRINPHRSGNGTMVLSLVLLGVMG